MSTCIVSSKPTRWLGLGLQSPERTYTFFTARELIRKKKKETFSVFSSMGLGIYQPRLCQFDSQMPSSDIQHTYYFFLMNKQIFGSQHASPSPHVFSITQMIGTHKEKTTQSCCMAECISKQHTVTSFQKFSSSTIYLRSRFALAFQWAAMKNAGSACDKLKLPVIIILIITICFIVSTQSSIAQLIR